MMMIHLKQKLLLIVPLSLLAITIWGCDSSHESRLLEVQTWGVFMTDEEAVLPQPDMPWQFSSCNAIYRTDTLNGNLRVWNIHFFTDHVEVHDAIHGVLLSEGRLIDDSMTLENMDGTGQYTGAFVLGQSCFELSDGESGHWHGIRMVGQGDSSSEEPGTGITDYDNWFDSRTADLNEKSQVIETSAGPIEYALIGESGPVLAFNHGGPGSFESTLAYFGDLFDRGFRILTWSRPGNLRTPLATGVSVEAQADALAALLDALSIDQVAVIAASAGGPPSYQFAIRHPQRTWALVAVDAISQAYGVGKYSSDDIEVWMYLIEAESGLWLYNSMYEYTPLAMARHFIGMISTLEDEQNDALARSVIGNEAKSEMLGDVFLSMSPSISLREGTFNDLVNYSTMPPMPLENIQAPTLIVHGTADGDVPMEDAEYAASRIPGRNCTGLKMARTFLLWRKIRTLPSKE